MGIFGFLKKKIDENQFKCIKCKKVLNKKYLHANQTCVNCLSKNREENRVPMKNTDVFLECRVCKKRIKKSAHNGYAICLDCANDIKKTTRFALLPKTFSVYKTISLIDMDIQRHHYGQSESYGLCTDGEHNYIFNYSFGNAGEGMFIIQSDNKSVTKDNYKELFFFGEQKKVELSERERLVFQAMLGYSLF